MVDESPLGIDQSIPKAMFSWLLRQGPAVMMLAAILYWLNGQAPAIIKGLVSDLIEQNRTWQSHQDETRSRAAKEHVAEVVKPITDLTKSVVDLQAEIRSTLRAYQTSEAKAHPGG